MAEKCINRNGSEKVSNVQKTNPKTATETRKEGLKKYTDMAIDPARLVPKCAITTFLPYCDPANCTLSNI